MKKLYKYLMMNTYCICEFIRLSDFLNVKAELKAGSRVNELCDGFDMLSLAVISAEIGKLDIIRTLLDFGASPNSRGLDGHTSLFWAASRGEIEFVNLLVGVGARIDADCSRDGQTALHIACEMGYTDIVACLLKTSTQNIDSPDAFSLTPLMYAARDGWLDIAKNLINLGADIDFHDASMIGDTALKIALDSNRQEVANFLIDCGANPNIPGWMGLTAKDIANSTPSKISNDSIDLLINRLWKRGLQK